MRMTSYLCTIFGCNAKYSTRTIWTANQSLMSGFYFCFTAMKLEINCPIFSYARSWSCSCCAISWEPKLERVNNNIQTAAAAAGYKSRRAESEPPDCDLQQYCCQLLDCSTVNDFDGNYYSCLYLTTLHYFVTVSTILRDLNHHGSTSWIDVDVIRSQC